MSTFVHLLPVARTMYSIFLALGLGVLLLNFIWQLFKNFGLGMGIEAEDPLRLTIRTILFMLLTVYSGQIVDLILDIGGTPYNWIVSASLPPVEFGSFFSVILTIIGGMVNGSVSLIALIFIIILAWNYLKLLLEAAERYILLGVLVFTAPVAFSMGGAQSTSNIFKNWCRMVGGQIFLLMMNAWCLKLFTTMIGTFIADPLNVNGGGLFIWMLCAISFLKVSQKIDSFMSSLGISVGHTGGSMLDDAIIAARGLSGVKKMAMGGFGGGKSGGGAGGSGASGPSTGFLSGGLAGAVGRKESDAAASNLASAPGRSPAGGGEKGGVFAGIGSRLYNNSVGEEGGFASQVIGSVATGNAARNGMITGDKAVEAMSAYMGDSIPSAPGAEAADLDASAVSTPGAADMGADIPMSAESVSGGDVLSDNIDSTDGIGPDGEDMTGGLPIEASQIPMDAGDIGAGIAVAAALDYADEQDSIPSGADLGITPNGAVIPAGADGYGDNGASAIDAAIAAESMETAYSGIPAGVDSSGVISDSHDSEAASPQVSGGSDISGGIADSGVSMGSAPAIPMDTGMHTGSTFQTDSFGEGVQNTAFASGYTGGGNPAGGEPPVYRNVIMGGGRITGIEVSPLNPKGIQFAMYHTGQYMEPEGKSSVVKSKDGEKWYKQYAVPAVEKTPVSERDGKVKYNDNDNPAIVENISAVNNAVAGILHEAHESVLDTVRSAAAAITYSDIVDTVGDAIVFDANQIICWYSASQDKSIDNISIPHLASLVRAHKGELYYCETTYESRTAAAGMSPCTAIAAP
ncbi:hypothetical protein FACS1894191_0640 [Clostridia bacterium]|nr:hypothetical protein FACS1894191_0640 [Clostridia bacterium]